MYANFGLYSYGLADELQLFYILGAIMPLAREQYLINKIRELPPSRVAEVEDFIDFLKQREQVKSEHKADSSLGFPVDDLGAWPEGVSMSREDLYGDDGR